MLPPFVIYVDFIYAEHIILFVPCDNCLLAQSVMPVQNDLSILSVQSYASILYLRVPSFFQMILRGKEIEHHNIVTDMMLKKEVKYKPVAPNGVPKDSNVKTCNLITLSWILRMYW